MNTEGQGKSKSKAIKRFDKTKDLMKIRSDYQK